jgi:hypothetical protein
MIFEMCKILSFKPVRKIRHAEPEDDTTMFGYVIRFLVLLCTKLMNYDPTNT